MSDCQFMSGCPIFAHFRNEGARNLWVRLYCKGTKQPQCERLKLRLAGDSVPVSLLPNGDHLRGIQ
jgi:hypothetical protein